MRSWARVRRGRAAVAPRRWPGRARAATRSGPVAACHPDDRHVEPSSLRQVVQRGEDLLVGEVAGDPEDHEASAASAGRGGCGGCHALTVGRIRPRSRRQYGSENQVLARRRVSRCSCPAGTAVVAVAVNSRFWYAAPARSCSRSIHVACVVSSMVDSTVPPRRPRSAWWVSGGPLHHGRHDRCLLPVRARASGCRSSHRSTR